MSAGLTGAISRLRRRDRMLKLTCCGRALPGPGHWRRGSWWCWRCSQWDTAQINFRGYCAPRPKRCALT